MESNVVIGNPKPPKNKSAESPNYNINSKHPFIFIVKCFHFGYE